MSTTGWLGQIGARGGPFVDAARSLIERYGEHPTSFPAGAEGVRKLVAWMEQLATDEGATESDEARFLEGAGSLLGLLLVQYVGDGEHRERKGVHRIRLGTRGFFDPFGAVQSALDASSIGGELGRQIRAAEAEARGEGPLSRIVVCLERQLRERLPHLDIVDQFECEVTLTGGVELDLRGIARVTEGETKESVDHAVARLIGMLEGVEDTPHITWHEARTRILPRLVNTSFVQTAPGICTEPLGHDVRVAFVLPYERRSRFIRSNELEAWNIEPARALASAIENLARRSEKARLARVDTAVGAFVVARTGDGLDAARLLLPGLKDVLASELQGPFFAAVPHRDTLLACASSPPTLVDALRERARTDAARAPHRISEALFFIEGASSA